MEGLVAGDVEDGSMSVFPVVLYFRTNLNITALGRFSPSHFSKNE